MKKLAAILALSLLLPAAALAKSYTLPDNDAVAVITIPDTWETEEIDDGVEASSPDDSVYLAVEVISASDVKAGVEAAIKYLIEKGVKVDESTQKQSEYEINGMKALTIAWSGSDSDGPAVVSVTIVIVNSEKLLLGTYWATPDGQQKNAAALDAIVGSVKRVGG